MIENQKDSRCINPIKNLQLPNVTGQHVTIGLRFSSSVSVYLNFLKEIKQQTNRYLGTKKKSKFDQRGDMQLVSAPCQHISIGLRISSSAIFLYLKC